MDRKLLSTLQAKAATLLAVVLMSATFTTQANTIKVHVLDANKSRPLKNVAVCLGTSANTNQFGAVRTDSKGYVHFSELPKTPLLLTVSGSQHKGIQRVVPVSNTTLVRTIHLPLGGLGPVCDAPATIIDIKPDNSRNNSLRIAAINLDKGQTTTRTRSVVLSPRIAGAPTHYRVSEDPSFKDSKWIEYQKTPLFTLSTGDGRKRVYYQVRKAVELDTGSIQTTSNVASDWITLKTQ